MKNPTSQIPGDCTDLRQLFLRAVPMLDLRAPVEFEQGAFAGSVNLPLMNDSEREQVGTCYKQQGQEAAITLGHSLVSGSVKAARMAQWKAFVEANPQGVLYCFRGGLRSRTTQQWLHEAGVDYPLVAGGYKAMRRFLIEQIETASKTCRFTILSGRTGSGKTRVLNQIRHSVDLEGLANHRGSSFGRQVTPQPTQINFENNLAVALLRHDEAGVRSLMLEDESRLIGSLNIPIALFDVMGQAPIAVMEEPMENRINQVMDDYVEGLSADYTQAFGEQGFAQYSAYMLAGVDRIRRRLGGERHAKIKSLMSSAMNLHQSSGDNSGHRSWIQMLLEQYYDPMYDYQLAKKADRVAFRGSGAEIYDWFTSR